MHDTEGHPARPRSEEDTLPGHGGPPASRETKRLHRRQVVAHLLSDIAAKLARAPENKTSRALSRKLESLTFVVDCWTAVPPSSEQLSAMLEVLLGLQEAAS